MPSPPPHKRGKGGLGYNFQWLKDQYVAHIKKAVNAAMKDGKLDHEKPQMKKQGGQLNNDLDLEDDVPPVTVASSDGLGYDSGGVPNLRVLNLFRGFIS